MEARRRVPYAQERQIPTSADWYTCELPECGYYVRRARTKHLLMLGQAVIDGSQANDQAQTVACI